MTDVVEDLLDCLPGELAVIADLIGLPATLRLVEARGGRRMFFPMTVAGDHMLVDLIGREAAKKLCEHYGGEQLEIPWAKDYYRALRDAHIRRSRASGVTQAALAGEHRLTERHIRNIERDAENDAQMGLF